MPDVLKANEYCASCGALPLYKHKPECAHWEYMAGRKDDSGKDRWALVPWDAVRAITRVLVFGAKKYEDRNWEKGMDWSRPFDALMRHITAWWEGEAKDPETGFSHLWHAGCCIVFLISYELRGIGNDNRPKNTTNLPTGKPLVQDSTGR